MHGPTVGWFAQDAKGHVRLTDRRGNVWGLEKVSILGGAFGFDAEGAVKLPRVFRYDSSGRQTVGGDRVLILFPDGNHQIPVVLPGIRSLETDDFLPYNHETEGADENRLAIRLRQLDSDHQEVGTIEMEAGHDGGGNVSLRLTGTLTITVERDAGDHVIEVDPDGNVTIDAGGSADVVVNGGAAKVARVGDKVEAHAHGAGTLVAGWLPVTGSTATAQPAIIEGADRFKG